MYSGHNDASFYKSVPLSQLRNPHNPLNRLKFLRFFNGALRPNFNKIVESWSGRYAAQMRLQHHTNELGALVVGRSGSVNYFIFNFT